MPFVHYIPPFKDFVEFFLFVYPVLAYVLHANVLSILYLLFLHSLDARWQLFPVYGMLITSIFFPHAVNGYFLVAYLALSIAITYNFPMCSPLRSSISSVGVQDICFEGEKTDFWVRFYYPTSAARRPASMASTVFSCIAPAIAVFSTSFLIYGDALSGSIYFGIVLIVAVEKMRELRTHFISYLPHGMTHENIANYARLPAFLFGHMNLMSIAAIPDAPWTGDASRPVVLLLHGLGACRSTYTSIAFALVEAGHVVICPEFGDGTPCYTSLPDGQCRPYQSFDGGESGPAYHAFRADQLLHREIEVKLIMKYLTSLSHGEKADFIKHVLWTNNGNGGFVSSIHNLSSSLILCGHSFGGATALHMATSPSCSDFRREHSIKAVVLLDPWMFPLSQNLYHGKQLLEYPTLCLHADRFQWPENLDFETKVMEACMSSVVQVRIQNCGHVSYCEMALLAPYVSAYLLRNTGIRDPLTCLHEICDAVKGFVESITIGPDDNSFQPLQCKHFRILYARNNSEK